MFICVSRTFNICHLQTRTIQSQPTVLLRLFPPKSTVEIKHQHVSQAVKAHLDNGAEPDTLENHVRFEVFCLLLKSARGFRLPFGSHHKQRVTCRLSPFSPFFYAVWQHCFARSSQI